MCAGVLGSWGLALAGSLGAGVGAWAGGQSWPALCLPGPGLGWPGRWAVGWLAGLAWEFGMGMGLREEDPLVAVVANLGFETSMRFETSIWVGSGF